MHRRVWKTFSVTLCWLVLSPGHLTAADERILYAPDIVGVERMFMIALKVPVEAPDVEVTMPDCIVMFDRTPVSGGQRGVSFKRLHQRRYDQRRVSR